jgi:hypothetical protein
VLGLGNTITGGTVLGWDPKSLGSTLLIWYKYNTGLSNLSGTDGTSANRLTWQDSSGNNNHAIQDTTANKPSISSGALDFEEDNEHYVSLTTAIDFDHPTPFTIFFVLNRESADSQNTLLGGGATEFISFKNADDKIAVRNTGTGGDNVTITFATNNLWATGSDFILSDGDLVFYKDGDAQGEDGGGTSRADGDEMDILHMGSKLTTGTMHPYDGLIKEVVICDTLLSNSDRTLTINYLKDKFSIS